MTSLFGGPAGTVRRARRALTVLVALLALVGSVGPLTPRSAAASHDDAPLDLGAMVLTPVELEDEGLEEYGADFSALLGPETEAVKYSETWGFPEDEALEVFEATGLRRSYFVRLSLPVDPDDRTTERTSLVRCTIYEFADEDGAEEALPFISGEEYDGFEEVEGNETIGDESVMSRLDWLDGDDPATLVDVTFRTGRIVANLIVWDVARSGEDEDPVAPEVELVEALGERFLERIEEGLDGDGPGLSNRTLRLDIPSPQVYHYFDRYLARDGEPVRAYRSDEETVEDFAEHLEETEQVDVYIVEQGITTGRQEAPGDPHFLAWVTRFEDEDAAERWLEDEALDEEAARPMYLEFEPVEDEDDLEAFENLGDGAVAAAVVEDCCGVEVAGYLVIVRVEDTTALLLIESADGVELETALELAEAQVECLEDEDGCLEPVAVPTELLG